MAGRKRTEEDPISNRPSWATFILPLAFQDGTSNLDSVNYNPVSRTLTVQFHGGRLYAYSGVPWTEYRGLIEAESHGSYFHARIRNRYPHRRLR
jgi:hypothetical protein